MRDRWTLGKILVAARFSARASERACALSPHTALSKLRNMLYDTSRFDLCDMCSQVGDGYTDFHRISDDELIRTVSRRIGSGDLVAVRLKDVRALRKRVSLARQVKNKERPAGGGMIPGSPPAAPRTQDRAEPNSVVMPGTLRIVAPTNNTQFVIDDTPRMPIVDIQVAIAGISPDPTPTTQFEWTAQIRFNPHAAGCHHGPDRDFAMNVSGRQIGGNFPIHFPSFMGGDLTITVKANVAGRELSASTTGLKIAAMNPMRTAIQAALQDETLQRIACHESRQRQFDAPPGAVARSPLWSGDNLGGVGIFQLTYPHPTDEEVWNWKANVEAGRALLAEKRAAANSYANKITHKQKFKDMVKQLNADRAILNLSPITVHVPPFTTAQLDDDSIRAFNGYGTNRDQFGMALHEFRLVMDGSQLRVHVDEAHLVGTVEWERVPVNQRGASGDPDYVNHVHHTSPNCGG